MSLEWDRSGVANPLRFGRQMTERTTSLDRPILLIGASGQVGWELRRTLAPLAAVAAPGRDTVDLNKPEMIAKIVRDTTPSVIVNAAAYTAVDKAEEDEASAHQINGVAPGVMAEEALRLGIPLIHFSTDYVFDGAGAAKNGGCPRAYREDDQIGPLSVYGRSKLAGERAIQAVNPLHLILRTSWVFSRRGANFLRTIQRLAAERDELRIIDDQIGSPTWARLLAEATAHMMAKCMGTGSHDARLSPDELGGLYHLTAAGSTSWCGFAKAIVDADRANFAADKLPRVTAIPTSDYPLPAKRPAFSVLDNSAIKRAFGIALPDWRTHLSLCMGR